jgi:hypothetical protein
MQAAGAVGAGNVAAIGMSGDPYNLENLKLPAEMVRQNRVPSRKEQKQQQHFIKVPWPWVVRLASAHCIATHVVADYLLYLNWKTANGALAMLGIERRQKYRALNELEQLGLIMIERRYRRSPLITIHLNPANGGRRGE